jgi:anti-sigma28 factor (negative regulator of flagellin synthesis)
MKTTDIVNEVARLMAQRELGFKDPKESHEIKAKRAAPEVRDAVELSDSAKAFTVHDASGNDYEKEQYLKVERLKSLVNGGSYHMNPEMVETIAERIANMLV